MRMYLMLTLTSVFPMPSCIRHGSRRKGHIRLFSFPNRRWNLTTRRIFIEWWRVFLMTPSPLSRRHRQAVMTAAGHNDARPRCCGTSQTSTCETSWWHNLITVATRARLTFCIFQLISGTDAMLGTALSTSGRHKRWCDSGMTSTGDEAVISFPGSTARRSCRSPQHVCRGLRPTSCAFKGAPLWRTRRWSGSGFRCCWAQPGNCSTSP
mmetsp:Transcript_20187/g.47771  ORF Transcript_20187/g.47771 Transcript_20187/m.47771 type:complete len:209 (+) Transcript_20187:255-881(+)